MNQEPDYRSVDLSAIDKLFIQARALEREAILATFGPGLGKLELRMPTNAEIAAEQDERFRRKLLRGWP